MFAQDDEQNISLKSLKQINATTFADEESIERVLGKKLG